MHIATTWDVIDLTASERLFGGMVEMAVLAAAPGGLERLASPGVQRAARRLAPAGHEADLAAYVDSLCAGVRKDDRWRHDLVAGMEGMDEARLRTILADLCVESGLVKSIRTQDGPVLRRLDALLDLAQVSFCATDVRAAHAALSIALANAAVSGAGSGADAYPGFFGGRFGRPAPAPELLDGVGPRRAAVAGARLLTAVIAAADCELPGLRDVLAVRGWLHVESSLATEEWIRLQEAGAAQADVDAAEQHGALLAWALGFVTAAAY